MDRDHYDVDVRQWEGDWLGSWYATVTDRETGRTEEGTRRIFKCSARRDVPKLIAKLKRRA